MDFLEWLGGNADDFLAMDATGKLEDGFQPVEGAEDLLDIWDDLKKQYENDQHHENLRPSEESHIL